MLDNFYFELSLNTLIIHQFDKVITVLPDLKNHFYKDTRKGLKLVSNSNYKRLKLERDIIYLERGGIQLESLRNFFKDDNLKKIGKIVIDKKSSLQIKDNH